MISFLLLKSRGKNNKVSSLPYLLIDPKDSARSAVVQNRLRLNATKTTPTARAVCFGIFQLDAVLGMLLLRHLSRCHSITDNTAANSAALPILTHAIDNPTDADTKYTSIKRGSTFLGLYALAVFIVCLIINEAIDETRRSSPNIEQQKVKFCATVGDCDN